MITCLSCLRGFYDECGHEPPKRSLEVADVSEEIKQYRRTGDITTSAGRKRAASLYLLDRSLDCEWKLLANCGGGKVPILGCITGKQVNRHHGPVKNTENNDRKNIHLICSPCHNLWHAKNDPVYDEEIFATLDHDPRPITPEEILRTR